MKYALHTRLKMLGAFTCAVLLAGCANTPPVPDQAALRQGCQALAGQSVAAAEIRLPSGVASVRSAALIAAANGLPEYCQVLGSIAARTADAEPIRFQLNLPIQWNHKALMYGGGGFNGVLITGLTPLRDAPAGSPLPITRGYATFGTDSGHDGTSYPTDPARFALNDEMFENFAFASYKKVKDVATVLMQRYYQRKPAQQYYFGGSEGGREGLMLAQRFPQDFDGIVAVVPVIQWNGLFNSFISFIKPQYNGGVLNPAKTRLIANAVNTACDGLDGLADGVIQNYLACPARFDVETLRCPGGTDAGDACLSDAQIATFDGAYKPTVLPFALANGLTAYPGRLFGGEIQPGEGIERWVSDGKPPGVEFVTTEARGVVYGLSYARNVIAREPRLDPRRFDAATYRDRIQQVSAMMDSTDPDLSAFLRRGGKLIIRENTGDMVQSPVAGMQYYDSVIARMGRADAERFLRLYVSPASSHGGTAVSLTTGTPVPTTTDLLATLDQWAAGGKAPDDVLIQVRNETVAPFTTLASRPMCRYPNHPQFVSGDPLKAASYRCVA
ncbi:tannase/feruloyl esterase family alpha/beta hydrolase [Variovorax rhizosphaerae]|uniref:Tannase/feruloyl esterase family alpha/beta hydrolase n=1 Tax=Variovorax rhizosphaerae TaxID=1836200 RepID=A0ABU8WR12_9BURK